MGRIYSVSAFCDHHHGVAWKPCGRPAHADIHLVGNSECVRVHSAGLADGVLYHSAMACVPWLEIGAEVERGGICRHSDDCFDACAQLHNSP